VLGLGGVWVVWVMVWVVWIIGLGLIISIIRVPENFSFISWNGMGWEAEWMGCGARLPPIEPHPRAQRCAPRRSTTKTASPPPQSSRRWPRTSAASGGDRCAAACRRRHPFPHGPPRYRLGTYVSALRIQNPPSTQKVRSCLSRIVQLGSAQTRSDFWR
jgi:hypothetical protein